MSVLIKGMKTPRICLECPLYSHTECRITQEQIPDLAFGKRPDWCPVITDAAEEAWIELARTQLLRVMFTYAKLNDMTVTITVREDGTVTVGAKKLVNGKMYGDYRKLKDRERFNNDTLYEIEDSLGILEVEMNEIEEGLDGQLPE